MARPRIAKAELIELLTLERLAEQYASAGYKVSRDVQLKRGVRVDLVAQNEREKIAIEVKSAETLKNESNSLARARAAVQAAGFRFLLHVAVPPQEKTIEIEGIEDVLTTYLQDHVPSELDDLAAYTSVEGVADIDIDEIHLSTNGVRINGTGVVEVRVAGGGGGEDGYEAEDSFPFTFDTSLDVDEMKVHDAAIEVDVTEYYE